MKIYKTIREKKKKAKGGNSARLRISLFQETTEVNTSPPFCPATTNSSVSPGWW